MENINRKTITSVVVISFIISL
jgi:hypothetical protein